MVWGPDLMLDGVDSCSRAHPYEEPAYEVYKMESF